MPYINGFVLAVPTASKEIYREYAAKAAVVFKERGALACAECWGDDVPAGKINSMHTAVMRKDDETVVFSWITGRTGPRAMRACKKSSPIRACSRM